MTEGTTPDMARRAWVVPIAVSQRYGAGMVPPPAPGAHCVGAGVLCRGEYFLCDEIAFLGSRRADGAGIIGLHHMLGSFICFRMNGERL